MDDVVICAGNILVLNVYSLIHLTCVIFIKGVGDQNSPCNFQIIISDILLFKEQRVVCSLLIFVQKQYALCSLLTSKSKNLAFFLKRAKKNVAFTRSVFSSVFCGYN